MRLSTRDIPQADSLKRLLSLLEVISRGEEVDPAAHGITSRQRAYYLHAAECLGLIDDNCQILEPGRATLALPGDARFSRLAMAFEVSQCGKAWIGFQNSSDLRGVNPASARHFLEEYTDLAPSSCYRRAQTLKKWLKDLQIHHPSGPPTFVTEVAILPKALPLKGIQQALFMPLEASKRPNKVDKSSAVQLESKGLESKGLESKGLESKGLDARIGVEPEALEARIGVEPESEKQENKISGVGLGEGEEVNALESDISRRLRTLLRTVPLLRLERHKAKRNLDLDGYDLRSISLRIFDTVISHMGTGEELTRSELHRELRSTLTLMVPEGSFEQHVAVLDLVLDGLLNEWDRRQAFTETWLSIEGKQAIQRILRFHLLREEENANGEIVLRATHEGINIYAGMLDTDVEDAQAAEEAILKSQLRRGRYQKALGTARRALQRSVEYEEKLNLHLRTTRRDITQVDWVRDVLSLLADAREHIKERLDMERQLIGDIESRLDVMAGQSSAHHLATLRDTLQRCFDRHTQLQGRVSKANQTWLDEQERQRFRPAMITRLPDPEADIMRPALALPMVELAAHFDSVLRWHNTPRSPRLLYLPHLLGRLLAPRKARHKGVAPPEAPDLEVQQLHETRFSKEMMDHVSALLEGHEQTRLSTLLELARQRGHDALTLRLLVLTVLRAFDEREEPSSLRALASGAVLNDPDFFGDDLLVWRQKEIST